MTFAGLPIALAIGACATPPGGAPRWKIETSATGAGATLIDREGKRLITMACTSGGELRVTVPSFTEVASEERLSFGLSDDPIALVAELTGAPRGVTARGPIPLDMPERVRSATVVNASYGSQSAGPFAPPTGSAREAFAKACADLKTGSVSS